MKIYTKSGDLGKTSMLGGPKIFKHNIRIEAYGTVDELNAHIGQVLDQIKFPNTIKELNSFQSQLFTIGSILATDPSYKKQTLNIKPEWIDAIEKYIDIMEESLSSLQNFILPSGHVHVSLSHVCRTVCRRAERRVVELSQSQEVEGLIIIYLNRLSDYFFVLARYFAKKLGVKEVNWGGV